MNPCGTDSLLEQLELINIKVNSGYKCIMLSFSKEWLADRYMTNKYNPGGFMTKIYGIGRRSGLMITLALALASSNAFAQDKQK